MQFIVIENVTAGPKHRFEIILKLIISSSGSSFSTLNL